MILSERYFHETSRHTSFCSAPIYDKTSPCATCNQEQDRAIYDSYCGSILPSTETRDVEDCRYSTREDTFSICNDNEKEIGSSNHDMEIEMKISSGPKNFKCSQCTYVTDRKNNLKRHIVTMHQECSRILECCGVIFNSKSLLREHVSLFHQTGYSCQICGRNFCRKALLRRHTTVHSGQKDFHCSVCNYATSHKSNLERHQKVHTRNGTVQSNPNRIDPCIGLTNREINKTRTFSELRSNLHDDRFPGNCHQQGRYQLGSAELKEKRTFSELTETFNKRNHFQTQDVFTKSTLGEVVYFREGNKEQFYGLIRDEKQLQAKTHIGFGIHGVSGTGSSYAHTKCYTISEKLPKCSTRALKDQKSTRQRNRLFAQPYKCPDCKDFFSSQWEVLNHTCSRMQASTAAYSIISVINSHSKKCQIKETTCTSGFKLSIGSLTENHTNNTDFSVPSRILPLKKRIVGICGYDS